MGLTRPFAGQPSLSDAGFTGDQNRTRACPECDLPLLHQPREFTTSAHERTAACEGGGHDGPVHGQRFGGGDDGIIGRVQAQLEHMLRAGQVLQLAHAQVDQHDIVGQGVDDEFSRRPRAQSLTP